MTEYVVKIGFWLRAYDSFTVEAGSDVEAVAKAKTQAAESIRSRARPEYVEFGERREGIIALIDQVTPDGRREVIENVEFDDDRIHGAPLT